jgi:methyltransferase (TIGR00027 family)
MRSAASEPAISDVSDTAYWIASYRASESERPDALFHDPLARRLAGDKGRKIAETMKGSRYTAWSVAVRTCIIDSYILEKVAEGVDTILNLGAGLDTRPYRLALPPELNWIEVDYPHVIQFKEERLRGETPRCRLSRVMLDLADRQARLQLFAEVSAQSGKVLVLTEGVVPYLSNDQVAALADDLRLQQNFRYWILDYFSPEVARYIRRGAIKRQMEKAPFRFDPGDWFGFFKDHGWAVHEIRYLGDESKKLGRAIPMPLWVKLLRALLPKSSERTFGRFSAYVLLEPI